MRLPLRFAPLFVLVFAFSMVGCQPADRLGPSGLPQGTVTHVVIIWLYDRADRTAQNEILMAGKKLEKLSGVASVTGGVVLPTTNRPVNDNSFDVAFVMTFHSESDLNRYLNDPAHLQIKKDVLDRYAKKYLVYDFVAQ